MIQLLCARNPCPALSLPCIVSGELSKILDLGPALTKSQNLEKQAYWTAKLAAGRCRIEYRD